MLPALFSIQLLTKFIAYQRQPPTIIKLGGDVVDDDKGMQ